MNKTLITTIILLFVGFTSFSQYLWCNRIDSSQGEYMPNNYLMMDDNRWIIQMPLDQVPIGYHQVQGWLRDTIFFQFLREGMVLNSDSAYLSLLPKPTRAEFNALAADKVSISAITDYAYPLFDNPKHYLVPNDIADLVQYKMGYIDTPVLNLITRFSQKLNKSDTGGKWAPRDATSDYFNEGSGNLYFTTARARSAISLTTTGSGAATYTGGVLNIPTYSPASWTINNNVSRSVVTTAAAANGFQISSTRNSEVHYSLSINTSVSLSGNASGYVVLEICPTNSATAGDWIEVSRVASGQSGSLVVGLILNQTGGGTLVGTVPVGYYSRLRSVNVSGTPTYVLNGNQEILK